MKRLVLVNPSEGNSTLTHNVIIDFPPLTLMTLAAAVPPDYEVEIIDEKVRSFDPAKIEADVVGITAFTCQAARAYAISAQLRERGIPVIMGGIHASMRVPPKLA